MKNIELTEEHKSKLLEMCKELFPEYKYFGWSELYDGSKSELIGIMFYKENVEALNIHWFEFCITKLSYKIFDSSKYPSKNAGDDTVQYLCDMMDRQTWYTKEAYHPVDYLYEEFLKLK